MWGRTKVTLGIVGVSAIVLLAIAYDRRVSLVRRLGASSETDKAHSRGSPAGDGAQSPTYPHEIASERARETTVERALLGELEEADRVVTVRDDAGHEINGATVWIVPLVSYEFPNRRDVDPVKLCNDFAIAKGVTNESGRLSLTFDSRIRLLLIARCDGLATGYTWCDETSGVAEDLQVTLQRRGGLVGGVIDGDTKTPAVSAFVTVLPRARPGLEENVGEVLVRYLVGESARTDANGRFRLPGLREQPSELFCSFPGKPTIYISWITPEGQTLSLAFNSVIRVSGIVLDSDGTPIPGASVRAISRGVMPLPETEPVHTNDVGEFVLTSVMSGPFELKVDKVGYGVVKREFQPNVTTTGIEIILPPQAEFAGQVVDDKGRGVQGALVRVVDAGQFVMCGQMESAEDGSWYMYWVPQTASVDVYVTKDGYEPANLRGIDAVSKKIIVRLRRVGQLSGRVIDERGDPIAVYSIHCATRVNSIAGEFFDRAESPWYLVNAPDGVFRLSNLAPGPQEVSVRARGYRPLSVDEIDVGVGETVGPVEFRLKRSPHIEGTVVDHSEEAVPGAMVDLAELTFQGEPVVADGGCGADTGVDGKFILDLVPEHEFTLIIRRGNMRSVFLDLSVGDFPRTFVIEPPGSIVGRVEGAWQRPETCVRIRVSIDRTWVGREVRPDGDGRFRIDELAPGDYRVELIDDWSEQERLRDGHVTRFVRVRSGETSELYLDATGEGVIFGHVNSNDSGIAGGRFVVRAFPPSGEGLPLAEAYVDPMGVFRLDHLHAGDFRVRVTSFDRGTSVTLERDVSVRADGVTGPVDFTFASGGLVGRVLRSEGGPADARVVLVAATNGLESASVRTDRDGGYRILGAPDGTYYVLASAAGLADNAIGPTSFPVSTGTAALEQRLSKESRLSVIVRDDERRPILDAAVSIDVSTLPAPLRRRSLNSNSSGIAEFVRLPAATISVGASRVGYVPADPISVGLAADQRRSVEITLARCGSIEITVKDERGQFFAGAEVTIALSNGDERGDSTRRSKTNSRGLVRFSGLRPAIYVISATGTGSTTASVNPGETTTLEISARR